jgi:hypothetical protein
LSEKPPGFVPSTPTTTLAWHGGLEMDLGLARYSFDTPTYPKEQFYDFRGRFVLGPEVNYAVARDYFAKAKAQLVAWLRETYGVYQINVDDVWAQAGQTGLWDVKLGRFKTWRVYHKGLGFDLYTLEDTGAVETPPYESGQFGPDIYEVNFMYLHETPGRAAFHLYPTSWSALELSGTYGKDGTSNTAGARAATLFHTRLFRLSGAAEYRFSRPAQETTSQNPDGSQLECDRCGLVKRKGFGGGAELSLSPVALGVYAARGYQDSWAIKDGTFDKNSSWATTSLGGFVQLDVGSLAIDRELVVGFGINRTEVLFDSQDFKRHVQWAAYAAYPLGFNDASIKFVFSRADLLTEEDTGGGASFLQRNSRMVAGRVRILYPF